jgi:hypothetical protein
MSSGSGFGWEEGGDQRRPRVKDGGRRRILDFSWILSSLPGHFCIEPLARDSFGACTCTSSSSSSSSRGSGKGTSCMVVSRSVVPQDRGAEKERERGSEGADSTRSPFSQREQSPRCTSPAPCPLALSLARSVSAHTSLCTNARTRARTSVRIYRAARAGPTSSLYILWPLSLPPSPPCSPLKLLFRHSFVFR